MGCEKKWLWLITAAWGISFNHHWFAKSKQASEMFQQVQHSKSISIIMNLNCWRVEVLDR